MSRNLRCKAVEAMLALRLQHRAGVGREDVGQVLLMNRGEAFRPTLQHRIRLNISLQRSDGDDSDACDEERMG